MSLHALKPRFVAMLRPLATRLNRGTITANQITVATAAMSMIVGGCLIVQKDNPTFFLLLPIWCAARISLNALDGLLAREFGQRTPLGAYLNELADVFADAALYLPFALIAPFSSAWLGTVIFLATVSELAGAVGPAVGAARRHDGPMGKSDRALVFSGLGLWVGVGMPLPPWSFWIQPILAVLLGLTILRRVKGGLGETAHTALARRESSDAR